MKRSDKLRQWALKLKRDTYAVYLAGRDPRTPWYAKVLAVCIVGYALSPIDLIPDFIPLLGYLDDLIIVPLGIAVAVKLIPAEVLSECREKAAEVMVEGRFIGRAAAAAVIGIWLLLAAIAVIIVLKLA